MANESVVLTYKGETIGALSSLGSLTLKTAGTYCEADIELVYINHCPRSDVTAYFDVAAFLAANPMGGTIKVKSAAE